MERRRIEREYKVTKWTLQLRSVRSVDQGDKVGGFLWVLLIRENLQRTWKAGWYIYFIILVYDPGK